jgi:hypothetical protein
MAAADFTVVAAASTVVADAGVTAVAAAAVEPRERLLRGR